jgi:hypothetical protein
MTEEKKKRASFESVACEYVTEEKLAELKKALRPHEKQAVISLSCELKQGEKARKAYERSQAMADRLKAKAERYADARNKIVAILGVTIENKAEGAVA